MSSSLLDDCRSKMAMPPCAPTTAGLADLVDHYAVDVSLPATEWVTYLQLKTPRRTIHCLPLSSRIFKRTTDIVLSVTLLILLSPVLLVVAVAVWLTSPGPVIFHQERVGLNQRSTRRDRRQMIAPPPENIERRQNHRRQSANYGRTFTLYKFRTMRTDAEKSGAQFAVRNDPRVTSIGWFLRRTRLDETPQLWNVLLGDMSLVGPRPERPVFIEKLSAEIPNYLDRLGLKPGLTGLAQVVNGYDNDVESFRRKVSLDLLYLQNCCLRNDLKILWRTIEVVITGKGAL